MTQATHTSALCASSPPTRPIDRLRTAIGDLRIRLSSGEPEQENMAGFSVNYRDAAHAREAQQLDITILAMAGIGQHRP